MLVKRLNISTATSDSTYLYGIKINYLVDSVHRLEKELDEIKINELTGRIKKLELEIARLKQKDAA